MFLDIIAPLSQIAKELRILRELYELDLESREKPIYRVTEKPSKKDTEVLYSGVTDDRPIYKKWFTAADVEEEED